MSKPRFFQCLAMTLASFLCGCSAEANVPRIVITQSGIVVDGIPNPNGVTTVARARFDHPVGFEIPKVLETSLYPRSAFVAAPDGEIDLRFVDELTLILALRSDEQLPPREIAHYLRDEPPGPDTEERLLNVPTSTDFNVVQYWAAGDAYYELVVRGVLPESDWTLNVVAQFRGTLSL